MTTTRRYYENITASVSEMRDRHEAAMRVSSTTALATVTPAWPLPAGAERGEATHSAGHR